MTNSFELPTQHLLLPASFEDNELKIYMYMNTGTRKCEREWQHLVTKRSKQLPHQSDNFSSRERFFTQPANAQKQNKPLNYLTHKAIQQPAITYIVSWITFKFTTITVFMPDSSPRRELTPTYCVASNNRRPHPGWYGSLRHHRRVNEK